ncbi:hypothetical protein [Streptococcus uberis]
MDLTKRFFDKFPDKMKEELKEFYEDLSEQEFDSKYATIMQCRRRWVLPRPIELIRFQDLFDIKLFAKMMVESLSQRGLQKEEVIAQSNGLTRKEYREKKRTEYHMRALMVSGL